MDDRLWELPLVLIQHVPGDQLAVQHIKGVVNVNFIGSILTANIPSKLQNSDGSPATTGGVKINVLGEQLFVAMNYSDFCEELSKRMQQ